MADIELLSPAGDMNALIAAIENGADAVYLGAKDLSARRGAGNFDLDEMRFAVNYCHERARRVYVAVNTVLKQRELGVLERVAGQIADSGADAAIVQDLGVARALMRMLPSLDIHASTQMGVNNRQGCEWLLRNGFKRAVLARELSFSEIAECARTGIQTEVFCHGALCVAFSGQCLFSSVTGGRSGNRGACAQPCRLPYRLTSPLGEFDGYLLSTKDIMTLDALDGFRRAGVGSIKIEGRLKRPEYVAIVTRVYRRALDGEVVTREALDELAQIFNRGGFTRGYAPGIRDSELISRSRPNHAGLVIGAARARRATLDADALAADEIVIRPANGADIPVKLAGRAGETVSCPVNVNGDIVRLVSDAQLKRARESFRDISACVPITARLSARVGERAMLEVTDGERSVTTYTAQLVQKAVKVLPEAEFEARARAQTAKTGGTPYRMERIIVDASPDAFLPASIINDMRRAALNSLASARINADRAVERAALTLDEADVPDIQTRRALVAESARTDALIAARGAGAHEIVYSPDDISIKALDRARGALGEFMLSLTPVLDGDSLDALNAWALANTECVKGVYITNVGQLALKWPGETRLDYELHLANAHAVLAAGARERVYTPSVELNAGEINDIGGAKELFVYGRLPLMRLMHCPLNACLKGGAHAACARCDSGGTRDVISSCALIDRKRARFPLSRTRTARGCVIEVSNCVPVMILRRLGALPAAARWRMRFTDEPLYRVSALTRQYLLALEGGDFKADNDWPDTDRGEATTGHYFRGVE